MKTDLVSFLNQSKEIFTDSGLVKVTGLNSIQIQDFTTGNSKPTIEQLKKIEDAIHCFVQEILNDTEIIGKIEKNSKCPNLWI